MEDFDEQLLAEGILEPNDSGTAAKTDTATKSDTTAKTDGDASGDPFVVRTEQWREEALRHPDDRQACIEAVTADMSVTIHMLFAALKRKMKSNSSTILEEPAVLNGIAAQTGLVRQWNTLLNFAERLDENRLRAEELRRRDPLLYG